MIAKHKSGNHRGKEIVFPGKDKTRSRIIREPQKETDPCKKESKAEYQEDRMVLK